MRKFLSILFASVAAGLFLTALTATVEPLAGQGDGPKIKLFRGAKPTPFPKIVAAIRDGKVSIHRAAAPPAQVTTIPPRLSYWGNNQFGICVTTESCFAIADYTCYVGLDEVFITEATCISWARQRGYLNGAELLPVIEDMQTDGIKDEKGVLRKAGKSSTVDYRNETTLQSAIAIGPVSIAIDADALPAGAGNKSGWYAFGGRSFPNTDHCVSLGGYGPAAVMFKLLGVPLPAGIDTNKIVYFLFSWNTIGIVDHPWLMNTCVEAWVRNPTVTGLQPPNPPDPPQPAKITVTIPNVMAAVGSPVMFKPIASGGTSPYLFLFDYGDGTQDVGGTHVYKDSGSYKVAVTAVDSLGQTAVGNCTATVGSTPIPPIPPAPGGLSIHLPQDTPAGTYNLVRPQELDDIQTLLDAIRGRKAIPKR